MADDFGGPCGFKGFGHLLADIYDHLPFPG
jgi:hypothetical protein